MNGVLSPLSGVICEIVDSVGQGNFTLILSGKSQGLLKTSGCGSHVRVDSKNKL